MTHISPQNPYGTENQLLQLSSDLKNSHRHKRYTRFSFFKRSRGMSASLTLRILRYMASEFRDSQSYREFIRKGGEEGILERWGREREGFDLFETHHPFSQIWFIKLKLHSIKEGFGKNYVAKQKFKNKTRPHIHCLVSQKESRNGKGSVGSESILGYLSFK